MEFGGAVRSGLEIVSIQGMADASVSLAWTEIWEY